MCICMLLATMSDFLVKSSRSTVRCHKMVYGVEMFLDQGRLIAQWLLFEDPRIEWQSGADAMLASFQLYVVASWFTKVCFLYIHNFPCTVVCACFVCPPLLPLPPPVGSPTIVSILLGLVLVVFLALAMVISVTPACYRNIKANMKGTHVCIPLCSH